VTGGKMFEDRKGCEECPS